MTKEVGHFDLTASALGLCFRPLLLTISLLLLVPAPWAFCWFYRWLLSQIQLSDATTPRFRGTPGSVWVLTTLWGGVFLVSIFASAGSSEENPGLFWLQLATSLAMIPIGWALLRWFIRHTELYGNRLRFDGSLLGYTGWLVLVHASLITIVGWAWVATAMYRWITRHVQQTQGELRFAAKGHQLLWRIIAFILFCLPLVTLPWAIKWISRWLVQQVELDRRGSAAAPAQ